MDRKEKPVKINDFFAFLFILAVAAIFIHPYTYGVYVQWYAALPVVLSFLKFALLATFGEMLVARLQKGRYLPSHFGLLPKMLIWGILGVAIWLAFGIFSKGVTATLFPALTDPGFAMRLMNAFAISFFMNLVFAPMMMLSHHITDMYIEEQKGRFPLAAFRLMPLLKRINWEKMWGFVFRKTIPLFWIPAHTITFLLPEEFRVLFAVLLSVVLGLLLSVEVIRKG